MAKKKESILLILVAGIGDLVLGSAAIRAIRNGHPDAEIDLLTNSQVIPIAQKYPYIDKVWPFPIRDILRDKKGMKDGFSALADLRRQKYDMCVNLFKVDSSAGAIRMGALFVAVGAKRRIGHDRHGFGTFLTKKAPSETFGTRHVADAMIEVARLAGGKPDDNGIEVFSDSESESRCRDIVNQAGLNGEKIIVGINPGGDRRTKRWSGEKFGGVAKKLIEEYGAGIIIFGGPGEEKFADEIYEAAGQGRVLNMAGKLKISDLIYISGELDLMITNDSGPMHIAAAAGAPIVCVFGPDDPNLTSPYMPTDKYIVVRTDYDCQPCFSDECENVRCMNDLNVEDVFSAAREIIDKTSTKGR